jgi:dTDP-4-amino-4,6-dideoxy-D-galactose acyltransferase
MIENLADLELLFESRKEELFYYSPYSFMRSISPELLFCKTIKEPLLKKIQNDEIQIITINIKDQAFLFLVEYLSWDSNYFGFPSYRLHSVLFDKINQSNLTAAIQSFKKIFFNERGKYCFTIIPSEDIYLLQALTESSFKLVETRLTYSLNLKHFNHERYSVRPATLEDIPTLRNVASEMRNPFDRFHADPIFEAKKADDFLATFIEESVKGFADYIIVPNEPGVPPEAFLTAKYLKEEWPIIGVNISKLILAAVSSTTCKGWYRKLISEMAYHLKSIGAEYVFLHPASTNKSSIHVYESLGSKLGQITHVFSCNSPLYK